jgi:3-oxoacyl-[acyl-carrier protein] reductase
MKSGDRYRVAVAISDIDADAPAEAEAALDGTDGDPLTHEADASDAAAAAFDGLDIVANNVGVAGQTKLREEITHEELMPTLSVNVGSLFDTTSAAIPQLKRGDGTDYCNCLPVDRRDGRAIHRY